MDYKYKNLGKVCLTPAGYWSRNKKYEKLDVVTDSTTNKSYIAKQDVSANTLISNEDYWQPISATGIKNDSVVVLYDLDEDGNLKVYKLEEAISSIEEADRRPGMILGFYGFINDGERTTYDWYLYQYNSDTIDDWLDLDKWVSIYDNAEKFKGYFQNEEELLSVISSPGIGDYAYVGESLEESVIYICTTNGEWTNSNTPAANFANLYEAVNSKDFQDLGYRMDEDYADRAEKDALGRVIHFTYITREGFINTVIQQVALQIENITLPDNCVTINTLDESVKQLISAKDSITNLADGEDLTSTKENDIDVLKFADKDYNEYAFSGLGRIYLRKNMADGINVLEQQMINKPNTIYIIQYDYCLNEATITIPENCELVFQGGSFYNGTVLFNGTKLTNILRKDDIGSVTIDTNSTFKIGQMLFDSALNMPIWYNGTNWVNAIGTIVDYEL